ncbi:HupE/UreJ family protein [Falsirhodobacter algicola]|uniref:HupE/UreJ family protein n=1 Tax=Falsirhodobacter algicola TaxID=2692330 RepID=A0A8J8MVP4_9RHOB|nr:hypothetical protein GR316_12110 [Falsirhodobacter algicola]
MVIITRKDLEARVLTALEHRLMYEAAVRIFCEEYVAELNRLRASGVTRRADLERDLACVIWDHSKLVDAIFAKRRTVTYARVGVVFGFGLLHRLGFASVLSDVGLHAGQFVTGLIGFNLGVELGQLCVIALAFLVLGLPFGRKPWYRARIAVPASCAIAAMGLYWTIERVI